MINVTISTLFEKFKQITKGFTPSANNFKEVEAVLFKLKDGTEDVTVRMNGILDKYVEEEFFAIQNAVTSNGKAFPEDITQDKFFWYCIYCLYQRISWVRNDKPDYRPQDNLTFPSLLAVISENIGLVTDDRTGLVIKPKMEEDVVKEMKKNLTKEDVAKISRFLEKSVPGYQGAKGYVKFKEGAVDFMVMQVLNGIVTSPRHDSHPVYSLLADIVGISVLDSAINGTQKYAEDTYLGALVSQLTSC